MKEGMVRLPLRDLVSFVDGFAVKSEDYVGNGKYRVLTISNVQQGHVDWKSFQSVADLPNGVRRSQVLSKGDMLISMTGNVGRIAIHDGVPAVLNQRVGKIVPIGIDQHYLYTALSSPEFRETMQSSATGGAQANLSKKTILDYRLPIPASIAEQKQIGEIFQDVNSLIASLERLIAKKQSVKQGMMQQLLTGRTRLPGFTESWTDSHAGELGKFRGGSGFPHRFQGSAEGDIPFYKVSDMNINGNEVFMRSANNYIKASERQQIGAVLMPAGSIIFAKVGAALFLERKRMLTVPSCIDNNMVSFTADESRVDRYFMYYVLSRFSISSLSATGALPSVNNRQLGSIPISMPRELAEQRAIAVVLRDIDSEIGALRKRLGKARDVKAGMMQQLLTGRVRLPVEVAV